MGDLNELIRANEKLDPTTVDVSHINDFSPYVKQCGLVILVIMVWHKLGLTNIFLLFQLMKGLIDV
jgi:hypothetical protein